MHVVDACISLPSSIPFPQHQPLPQCWEGPIQWPDHCARVSGEAVAGRGLQVWPANLRTDDFLWSPSYLSVQWWAAETGDWEIPGSHWSQCGMWNRPLQCDIGLDDRPLQCDTGLDNRPLQCELWYRPCMMMVCIIGLLWLLYLMGGFTSENTLHLWCVCTWLRVYLN